MAPKGSAAPSAVAAEAVAAAEAAGILAPDDMPGYERLTAKERWARLRERSRINQQVMKIMQVRGPAHAGVTRLARRRECVFLFR